MIVSILKIRRNPINILLWSWATKIVKILRWFSKSHLSLRSCKLIINTPLIYIIVLYFDFQISILEVSNFLFLRFCRTYPSLLIHFITCLLRLESTNYFLLRNRLLRGNPCWGSTNNYIKIILLRILIVLHNLRLNSFILIIFFFFLYMSILLIISCYH